VSFADRVSRIQSSITLELSAKAKALKKAGEPVINLSVGEPDFPTPANIQEAAIRAMQAGHTKYTASSGIPELRQAVAERVNSFWNTTYDGSNIVIGCGAKHTISNTVLATCQRGDEVIILAPYWVSYPEMIHLAHADAVVIPLKPENDFKLQPDELKKHITKKTRLIIFNSPSNPTGVAYESDDLEPLVPILADSGIWIASDEIYCRLIYDGRSHRSFAQFKELQERLVIIDGWSKAYAMTGWRIGFLAGPKNLASAVGKIQSHTTSHASSIAQYAALEAIQGPEVELMKMIVEFQTRRDIAHTLVNEIPHISCRLPEGAFYLFVDVRSCLNQHVGDRHISSSFDLCAFLLDEFKLAVVPGSAFGAEGFIRMSYAASRDEVREGIERLATGLSQLT